MLTDTYEVLFSQLEKEIDLLLFFKNIETINLPMLII